MRRAFLLAIAASGAACGYSQLHLRAAHDLECASDKLEETQIDDSRVRFVGCGKKTTYFCSIDTRGVPYCEREKPDPRATVQEAAGALWKCPSFKVVVDPIDAIRFSAKACGFEGVFVCVQDGGAFRCDPMTGPSPATPSSGTPPPRSASPPPASSAL